MLMETDFLRSFLLTVQAGSMSEAARRQDCTPAAIAQQIRALERELGTALVARSGRTVRPTEAGQRLAERAAGLLRGLDELRGWVNEEAAAGELRIGAINTALHSVLPEVLRVFTARCPQVWVRVEAGMSDALYGAVQRGELDAAVCLHPPFQLPKTLDWALLREEPLVVLAPARLARRDAHELLATQPFIRYDRALGGGKQAERYLRRAGIVPLERYELSSLLAIGMLVERGLGVSLVPDMTSPLAGQLRVARLPLPQATEPRRFGVLWPRGTVRARLVREFVNCARTVVEKR
jgi:DNA-binding transcriptional LysR family regulator